MRRALGFGNKEGEGERAGVQVQVGGVVWKSTSEEITQGRVKLC